MICIFCLWPILKNLCFLNTEHHHSKLPLGNKIYILQVYLFIVAHAIVFKIATSSHSELSIVSKNFFQREMFPFLHSDSLVGMWWRHVTLSTLLNHVETVKYGIQLLCVVWSLPSSLLDKDLKCLYPAHTLFLVSLIQLCMKYASNSNTYSWAFNNPCSLLLTLHKSIL